MELLEEITAYVDNELNDPKLVYQLEKLIENDEYLRKEYLIQKSVKELLHNRLADDNKRTNIYENLRKEIYSKIKKSIETNRS